MRVIILILSIGSFLISDNVTESFNITGMFCNNACVDKVESIMNSIEGVEKCKVDYSNSLLTVKYDNTKVNSDLIISSISEKTTYKTTKYVENNTPKKSFWKRFKNIFNKAL